VPAIAQSRLELRKYWELLRVLTVQLLHPPNERGCQPLPLVGVVVLLMKQALQDACAEDRQQPLDMHKSGCTVKFL
jgi:hypothetical protein